jgi:hypothetical protein
MGARAAWPALAGPSLLCASGTLMVLAAARRWWPACPLGGFDDPACLVRQDDAYSFVPPHPDWTPLGDAAEMYGAGVAVLGVALVLVPGVLLGTSPGRMLRAGGWLVALGVLVGGVSTFLSGATGAIVAIPGQWVADLLWVLGLPLLLVAAVAEAMTNEAPRLGWRAAAAGGLLLSHPIVVFLLAPALLLYSSFDATPWTEAVGGWALVVAGVCLAMASRPVRVAPTTASTRAAGQSPTAGDSGGG